MVPFSSESLDVTMTFKAGHVTRYVWELVPKGFFECGLPKHNFLVSTR